MLLGAGLAALALALPACGVPRSGAQLRDRHEDAEDDDDVDAGSARSDAGSAAVDGGAAIDAAADAGSIACFGARATYGDANADDDHDGIANCDDNCPSAPNPDQANEDGDAFGDACDRCPAYADDSQQDSDCDGVSDPCDPRPTTPGDRIAFFEGFDHGLPPGWEQHGAAPQAIAGALVFDVMNGTSVIDRDGSHDHNDTLAARISGRVVSTTAPTIIGIENGFTPASPGTPETGELCFNANFVAYDPWPGSATLPADASFASRLESGTWNSMGDYDTRQDVKILIDRRGISEQNTLGFWCMEAFGSQAIKWDDDIRGSGLFVDRVHEAEMDAMGTDVGFHIENGRATLEWMMMIESE